MAYLLNSANTEDIIGSYVELLSNYREASLLNIQKILHENLLGANQQMMMSLLPVMQSINTPSLFNQSLEEAQRFREMYALSPLMMSDMSMMPWRVNAGISLSNNDNTNNNNNNNNMNNDLEKNFNKKDEETSRRQGATTRRRARHTTRSTNNTVTGKDKEKTFTCGVCNRSFGYKHVLQNHARTHTGEKPFECVYCGKRFTRDHHLKTHTRLHTGEKPYHCEYCTRQFVQVANLRRHTRIHTGERPYDCIICSSKFSDSNQLKTHLRMLHKEEMFEHFVPQCEQCEQCGMNLTNQNRTEHRCAAGTLENNERNEAESPNESASGHDETTSEMAVAEITTEHAVPMDLMLGRVIQMAAMPIIGIPPPRLLTQPLDVPEASIISSLPMQTEPEDLSMSTGMRQSEYRTNCSDSSKSRSSSRSPASFHVSTPDNNANDEKHEASLFLGNAELPGPDRALRPRRRRDRST